MFKESLLALFVLFNLGQNISIYSHLEKNLFLLPPQNSTGHFIIANQKTRISDAWGKGHFLDSRDGGKRTHKGLDIVAKPGEKIFMPFDGTIIREAVPYEKDMSYRGLEIKGTGEWKDYRMKIFYVDGLLSGTAKKGQEIGFAQNLTTKFPGITNHIHVEVKKAGTQIDPFEVWKMSF